MDKIVLDTFTPDASCFEPPPASSGPADKCVVKVTFHTRDNPGASQPVINFQREKDHYIYAPGSLAIQVLQGLGFDEKNLSVQSTLHFEVFLQAWFNRNYPDFKTKQNYKGPDLMPLSLQLAHFIAAGDIEQPDSVQRASLSKMLRELLSQFPEATVWFRSILNSLTSEKSNLKLTPLPMRPRVQWVLDQMNLFDRLNKTYQGISGDSDDPSALRGQYALITVGLLDYLSSGEKKVTELKKDLDALAKDAFSAGFVPQKLKDPFSFFAAELEAMSSQPFFAKNAEAKKRLILFQAYLKSAEADHRAELFSLPPAQAFRKSLEYRIGIAAEKGYLASRVKNEMEDAHLSPKWLQDHAKEISKAIIPHFTLVQKGSEMRVKIDIQKIRASTEALVNEHYIQEREYRIGVLSFLRYFLGEGLGAHKIEAWVKDGYKEIEIDQTAKEIQDLLSLRDEQGKKISKSVKQTSLVLPIAEGGLLAAGVGIGVYGLVKEKGHRSPWTTAGAIAAGAGGGALACNSLWKSRNQYITDGICGLIGGAALGLSSGFLLKPAGAELMPPPGYTPPPDGRNPVSPFGP